MNTETTNNTKEETKEDNTTSDNLVSYEVILEHLFQNYPWFKNRFETMDASHQTALKLFLGENNSIALHLQDIFDRCLSETKETLLLNTWRLKKAEYRLFMLLGIPAENDIVEPIQEIILATGMQLK